MGPHAPDDCPQSSVVAFDTLQLAPGSIISALMEEQQGVIESQTNFSSLSATSEIQAPGKQQTSLDDRSGQQVGASSL